MIAVGVIKHGDAYSTHKTRLYRIWCSMKRRCDCKTDKVYPKYGGRGITYCKEWSTYPPFKEWAINNGYSEGLTIDRIDNNGNYCPENCRWVDHKTQNRNYSKNVNITYNGETHCLSDWADIIGIDRSTLGARVRRGNPIDEIFDITDRRTTRTNYEQVSKPVICLDTNKCYPSVKEAAIDTGCDPSNVAAVCRHVVKTTHKMRFMFLEEYMNNEKLVC